MILARSDACAVNSDCSRVQSADAKCGCPGLLHRWTCSDFNTAGCPCAKAYWSEDWRQYVRRVGDGCVTPFPLETGQAWDAALDPAYEPTEAQIRYMATGEWDEAAFGLRPSRPGDVAPGTELHFVNGKPLRVRWIDIFSAEDIERFKDSFKPVVRETGDGKSLLSISHPELYAHLNWRKRKKLLRKAERELVKALVTGDRR